MAGIVFREVQAIERVVFARHRQSLSRQVFVELRTNGPEIRKDRERFTGSGIAALNVVNTWDRI